MRVIGVIPSRYGSTRFPGKPLAKILGKSLVERVYLRAKKAELLDDIIVATDDKRIFEHVKSFGGKVVMTSTSCVSGTDRLAEVARGYDEKSEIVINIQGDEPLVSPKLIDSLIVELKNDRKLSMVTAACGLSDKKALFDPNIVKLVLDKNNFAMYFSRAAIPYLRSKAKPLYLKHMGIYGYRRDFLLKYADWPQTKLEKFEMLEQLRAMENGCKIKVVIARTDSLGVDVPGDIEKIEKRIING